MVNENETDSEDCELVESTAPETTDLNKFISICIRCSESTKAIGREN